MPISDPALATTNRSLDEANDQNSEIINQLARMNAAFAASAGGSGRGGIEGRWTTAFAQV